MKKIIAATDLSARSDRAVRRATLLARTSGATVSLVHIVDDDRSKRIVEAELEAATSLLSEQARSLREIDGIDCTFSVIAGLPYKEMIKAVQASMADLLVIGPHRHQALTDIFAGTTAERAIRVSSCPVLVANGVPAGFYRHVLVAVDLSDCSGEALRTLEALELDKRAAISVVHVFEAPAKRHMTLGSASNEELADYLAAEEARAAEELAVFMRAQKFTSARRLLKVGETSVGQTIRASARETSADLIVVGTRGRTGVSKLLLGSVAEDLLHVAEHDVLVVPPPQR